MKVLPITKSVKITEVDIGSPLRSCGGKKTITTFNITLIFVIIMIFNENFQNQINTTFWSGKINLSSITYSDIWLLLELDCYLKKNIEFNGEKNYLVLIARFIVEIILRLNFFFMMIRHVWKCLNDF